MIFQHIMASLLGSVFALTSGVGLTADSIKTAVPRAEAQVTQQKGADHQFHWNGWGNWRGTKPVITDISPEEGATGTTVTLTGKRFDDDNIVRFGRGAIHDVTVSEDGTMLTFVIPESMGRYCPPWRFCTAIALTVDPGKYNVRVQDGNKTSNAVHFKVTESDEHEPLTIDSISGPTALTVGAEGTWKVTVSSEGAGNLQYSVQWGDEQTLIPLRLLSFEEKQTQSSAIFTHTYTEAGTYHPEFIVTDEDGNTVESSTTVVVTDEENKDIPHITLLSPTSVTIGSTVTVTGTGFDEDSTVQVGNATGTEVDVKSETELTFTIPALTHGVHSVSVTDNDGTSNSLDLKVFATSKVSIFGIDAPSQLSVGEAGTWTVDAASNADGNLKYSVEWGDEGLTARMRMMIGAEMTQSSASFTHSYDTEGTYYPKFTVTDVHGNKSSVSASVIVSDDDD